MPIVPRQAIAGTSVEGRPIEYISLGDGQTIILILATIHGNEPAGTPLVHRLREYLVAHPELLTGRRVVLVPVANPDGLARGTRTNARGIDLNRNFPAGNYASSRRHGAEPLCEPESRALSKLLERFRPQRIVSIHQGLDCVDYDGPGEALAQAMVEQTYLPLKKLGGRPGSFGSYAGIVLGIPVITPELPRSDTGRDAESLWQDYGRMLLAAVCFPDPVPAE
ncbi:MAG: DUF2817 domain-containing protein [Phycisphaerae bacterium]|nr:DUF2817 domain-containing protein [Phycisphaerae bacterium]